MMAVRILRSSRQARAPIRNAVAAATPPPCPPPEEEGECSVLRTGDGAIMTPLEVQGGGPGRPVEDDRGKNPKDQGCQCCRAQHGTGRDPEASLLPHRL